MGQVFEIPETTIAAVQRAYRNGALTVRDLVQAYLDRIQDLDRSGPELNSVIALSPGVLEEAERLDRHFAERGELVGPLHGVPVLVKDQIEVGGMPTSYGSEIAAGHVPDEDSTVVSQLRKAGAVILGDRKSTRLNSSHWE